MAQRISVGVGAQKLLDAAPPTNLLPAAVLEAVRTGGSIPAALIAVAGGQGSFEEQVDDYYDKGSEEPTIGVPVAFNFSASDAFENSKVAAVRPIIAASEATTTSNIVIVSIEIQYCDPIKVLKEALQDNVNWSPTAQGYIINGAEYYVRKATFNAAGTYINATLKNEGERGGGNDDYLYVGTAAGNYSLTTLCYHVIYYKRSQGAAYKRYWNYANDSGPEPTIDIDGSIVIGGRFFPMTPIRVNKVWIDAHPYWSQSIATVNDVLATIGLEYYMLKDAIDPTGKPGSTSELANLDESIITFSVDIYSTTDPALNYLFEQFKRYHYTLDGTTQSNWWAWFNETGAYSGQDHRYNTRPRNVVEIRSNAIKMAVEYQWSTCRIVTGNINTDSIPSASTIRTYRPAGIEDEPVPDGDVVRKFSNGTEQGSASENQGLWTNSRLVFRKPLAANPGSQYIEVFIYGLKVTYEVAFTWDNGNFYREVTTGDDSWTDGGMVMPISQDICKLFTSANESAIYYETLMLVSYASEIYDISWWEGAFASFLFFVVQVVVTIATLGTGTGLLTAAKEGLVALAKFIIIRAITGFLITIALTAIIDILGVEIGFILAVIAMAGAIYSGISTTEIMGAFNAENLLAVTNALVDATGNVLQKDFADFNQEQKEFNEWLESEEEKLEKARDFLEDGQGFALEVYQLIKAPLKPNFNEGPQDFYNRTIHNGNPGVVSLNGPSLFASLALMLPEPDHT